MGIAVRPAGGGMVGGGGGGAMEAMGGESTNAVLAFIAGLPAWAQAIINILIVAAAAAIIGMVIGKMYASVRYPDPEKHHLVHPVVRLVFICLIAACSIWLFVSMTKQPEPDDALLNPGEEMTEGTEAPPDDYITPAPDEAVITLR